MSVLHATNTSMTQYILTQQITTYYDLVVEAETESQALQVSQDIPFEQWTKGNSEILEDIQAL